MAAGDITQGRRVGNNGEPYHFAEGDYGHSSGQWWCRPPTCDLINISTWHITEHDDGTISVSPSILVYKHDGVTAHWHGYLEHGVWREV